MHALSLCFISAACFSALQSLLILKIPFTCIVEFSIKSISVHVLVTPLTAHLQSEGMPLELGELKDVADNRLKEIEDLHSQLAEAKAEVERLKLDAGNIAEADVKASSVFKALQSHFSVVFAENSQQRAHLEETKRLLVASKQQHMAQVSPFVCQCISY